MSLFSSLRNTGPGALVTAAFIGPGTVTACTLAGANYGYALLWALLFATIATIILQEMSARLGLISQKGLGENLRDMFAASIWKWPLAILVITALYIGNAAYEAGNLSGGALGVQAVFNESLPIYRLAVIALSLIAAGLIWRGAYKLIERVLIALVGLMALAFIASFISVGPDIRPIIKGLLVPQIPPGSLMTIIALIGTTIVPYNLFLHASAVKSKWSSPSDLKTVRQDTSIAIGLGGLITLLIAATAAASLFGLGLSINGAGDMAKQIEPLFGPAAKYMLGLGFLAAGLTSTITAPLATAFAVTEILGLNSKTSSRAFRGIALSVISIGAALALTGIKPITIILSAQFANGLLLPIIAIFLLAVMNRTEILGRYKNGPIGNILGVIVVGLTALLGARLILKAAGIM